MAPVQFARSGTYHNVALPTRAQSGPKGTSLDATLARLEA